ncbi:hypothetical protein ABBQ32_001552 [Trebouxia sp. C0010 RCD-2024]
MLASEGKPHFQADVSDTLQVWARSLYDSNAYAVSQQTGNSPSLHLFPFQQDGVGILFLGFLLPPQAAEKARLLRSRILLVLDLDETLVTSEPYGGVQFYLRQCRKLDESLVSPARQAVEKLLVHKHAARLVCMAQELAQAKHPRDRWLRFKLIVEYLNDQLSSLQQSGCLETFRGGVLETEQLLTLERTRDLPARGDVLVARELNNLGLKLKRVWFLLHGVQTAQQLQSAVERDAEVQEYAPAAKLEVIEFSLRQRETDHEPQHRFRIRITGQLQSMQQSLNEDAVYTQYFQELLQP